MSELGSSQGGSSIGGDGLLPPPGQEARLQVTGVDGEEEDEELEEQQSLINGVFGVIYTVSRERTVTWRFVAFKTFLDCWQLLMLTINPQYGWKIDSGAEWWSVVGFIQLTSFMTARGLTFFLACLYIFVVLLVVTVGLCVWVAWSSKRFDRVWPIAFLRWFGVIFFQMLDVASMSFFLITLDCQYFDVNPTVQYFNQEFPSQYCWSMPYMINAVVAALSLLVFVALTALFQMGEMELNQKTRNPLAMAHSMVEVQSFLLKFLMTAASTFLNNLKWLSTFYTVCTLLLLYISLKWTPYYFGWMNCIRSGVNATVLYSAAMLMLLVFAPGVNVNDADAQSQWHTTMSIVLVAGLVPAGLLGALAAHFRLRHFLVTVVAKFRRAAPGTKPHFIQKFSDPLQVEVASRCCRKWVDEDTLDPEAVAMAGTILRAGMQQLPGSAYMSTLYAAYLIEVQGSYQSGLLELKAAKKADPSFLEQFAIFNLEQQNTQRASGAKGSKGADLVSYVEQQRDYRLAMKVHKESLCATSVFWRALIHPVVKLEQLAQAVAEFDHAVKEADSTYRSVILRHPDNWKLIRIYAKFVEFVKNDPWTAAKWSAEADRLFQAEDDEKHNAVLSDALDGGNGPVDAKNRAIKAAMEDCNRGVIVINAQCTITAVNKTCCDVLGYVKKALLGKNINMLIPHPFSKPHDSYVASYVHTGDPSASPVIDKPSHMIMLHKDRSIVPITLVVSKISGIGMDSMFMGIFEHVPPPADVACAWALANGSLVSVDATFSDWFGHQAKDLPPGTYINSLVVDSKALADAFKDARAQDPKYRPAFEAPGAAAGALLDPAKSFSEHFKSAHMAGLVDSSLRVEGTQVKHKYAGPITCGMTITNGGSGGNRHYFALTFDRPAECGSIIVTDRRGKLCHVSRDLAQSLGYPVSTLLGEMASTAWDALLPEPFCQLHRAYIMKELPHDDAPPYSCRSGLSTCLLAMTPNGPEPTPFKMEVKQRKMEGGEACSIVSLEKCSVAKALDERRLTLLVDENGYVVDVGHSPESMFGFDPLRMLGRRVNTFVDVFQPEGAAFTDDAASDAHMQETLVELAVRSVSAPGSAYRVGVTAPTEMQVNRLTGPGDGVGKPRRASALDLAVAARITQVHGTHPAVMQVKLHQGGPALDTGVFSALAHQGARPAASYAKPDELLQAANKRGPPAAAAFPPSSTPLGAMPGHVSSAGMRQRVSNSGRPGTAAGTPSQAPRHDLAKDSAQEMAQRQAAEGMQAPCPPDPAPASVLTLDGEGSAAPPLAAYATSLAAAAGGGAPTRGRPRTASAQSGLLLEVQLWKVDLLSGLLQVDATSGCIVGTSDMALHQPGPLLGVDSHALLGAHIGDVLAPMQHRPLSDLFLPELGAAPLPPLGAGNTVKRGGLKVDKKNGHFKESKPGALSVVTTPHLADGMSMQLTVQAIPSWSHKKVIHVMLHIHHARTGMANFKDWLQANPAARALPSKAGLEEEAPASPAWPAMQMRVGSRRRSLELPAAGSRRGSLEMGTAAGSKRLSMEMSRMPERAYLHELGAPAVMQRARRTSVTIAEGGGGGSGSVKAPALLGEVAAAKDPEYDDLDHALVALGQAASNVVGGPWPPTPTARPARAKAVEEDTASQEKGGSRRASKAESMTRVQEWVFSGGSVPAGSDTEVAPSHRLSPASLHAHGVHGGGDSDGSEEGEQQRVRAPGKDAASEQRRVTGNSGVEFEERQGAHEGEEDMGALLLLKDAEGALGKTGRPPSDRGSDVDDAPADPESAASLAGDYKRGARFRRVARMLTGEAARAGLRRFKLLAWGAAAFVLVVTLACFVAMYTLLLQQQQGVAVLNTVGRAGVETGEVYMAMVTCDMLFMQTFVHGLAGIDSIADIPSGCLTPSWTHAQLLQDLLEQAYYVIMGMPDDFGLHELWNSPTVNATMVQDTIDPMSLNVTYRMMSLWDIGHLYVAASQAMSQNILAHNSTPGVKYWRQWSYPQIIEGNTDAIFTSVFTTLDALVQIVIEKAASVNSVQYVLMAVEGIVSSTLAAGFVYLIVTKMTAQRWNLYNVFMVIPVTLLKGLAKKTAAFEDLGPVDPEAAAGQDGAGAAQAAGLEGSGAGGAKMTIGGGNGNQIYLCSPFICWGLIMVAINASGHAKLAQVSGPIAIFNLVNTVTMMYYRSMSENLDMMQVSIQSEVTLGRTRMAKDYTLPTEYMAMLYGASAIPNTTQPRYLLATTGVAFTQQGEDLMYHTHDCLRTNQSMCLPPTDPMYPFTVNGLDTLMQLYMRTVQSVQDTNDTALIVVSQHMPQFTTMWTTRDDLEGGLTELNDVFYDYVISVYRPYVNRLSSETKRIAQLLSQLPTDVDVESLVRRAQADVSTSGAKAEAKDEAGFRADACADKSGAASGKGSFNTFNEGSLKR